MTTIDVLLDSILATATEIDEERKRWKWIALFLLDFAELCWTCGAPGHNRYNCPHDEYFGEGGLPQSFWLEALDPQTRAEWTLVHLNDYYERRGDADCQG